MVYVYFQLKDTEGHWVDCEDWPDDRTVVGMKKDFKDNLTYTREREGTGVNNNTMRNNGPKFHSIYAEPALSISTSMDHVAPPTLHILLGLVKKFFEYLELVCREMDTGKMDGRDSNVE